MNDLLCGLAANPALPPPLTDRLIALAGAEPDPSDDRVEDLVDALADRPDLSRAQVRALAAHHDHTAVRLAYGGQLTAADVDPSERPLAALALLDEGRGRPEWAHLLAADPDPRIRWRLASCPALPPEVVDRLAADPDVSVVAELALWTTAVPVAARLARHPHAEVRYAAALNEAVPPVALAALVTGHGLPPARSCLVCDRREVPFAHDPYCPDTDCALRSGAACDGTHGSTVHETWERALRNPATPPEVAASLCGHPSMLLRWALAERSDLSPHVYARLAEDPVPRVREAVAENPAIEEDLARVLAADGSKEVRRGLARHPRLPLDVLSELAVTIRIGPMPLPRIAAAPPAELAELAASPRAAVRMLVAQRRDLPPEVRDALAGDPDAAVVKAIAPHPGLSEALLRAAVTRHGVRVLAAVAANPDASGALLEDLARHQPPVRKVVKEVARHPNATAPALLACLAHKAARALAAAHPALPAAVVVELLADEDPRVVEAAAGNPALPRAVMAELVP